MCVGDGDWISDAVRCEQQWGCRQCTTQSTTNSIVITTGNAWEEQQFSKMQDEVQTWHMSFGTTDKLGKICEVSCHAWLIIWSGLLYHSPEGSWACLWNGAGMWDSCLTGPSTPNLTRVTRLCQFGGGASWGWSQRETGSAGWRAGGRGPGPSHLYAQGKHSNKTKLM